MRLELNDRVRIRMNKNFTSLVLEARAHDKLSLLEKDCRNHMEKVRGVQLGEGDANAMYHYFVKIQSDNSDFFYVMDLNEEGRLQNIFWANARSRAAFKEFGDVVTFDTTYLVNKYGMPFAPLCPPNAIITDQYKAMKNAIQIVFPNARHRWCLWHIMKKLPEKLRGYKEYEPMKFCLQNVVYDLLTREEFEENWGKFIEKYQLESNEWLLGFYEERHRWVPAFVKDIFWTRMSTIQLSESMHAFFDGYINAKTTLKQFVEQYENALAKKVENENNEEFNSFNSYIPCITQFPLEKQFQKAYTIAKFKEFQQEVVGKIYCYLSPCKEGGDGVIIYGVGEEVPIRETLQRATFTVYFKEDSNEANCNCRLFEFRGILCRHQIVMFMKRGINRIPEKYILKRWNKNVKRCHIKVRISYDNCSLKAETCHYDKMFNVFNEVADLATECEDKCGTVVARLCELKGKLKQVEVVCGSSHGDGLLISKGAQTYLIH